LLLALAETIAAVKQGADPKLRELAAELVKIAAEAEEEGIGEDDKRDKRKVIVFTYFADTVEWIREYLGREVDRNAGLAAYGGRVVALSGRAGTKEEVLFGFAPRTTEAPAAQSDDLFDVVVATDVLSEGVNLQQARHIINYDL